MAKSLSENEIDKVIGARVRSRRITLGLTQRQLGGAVGVTSQQIQKCETGADRIGASRLLIIAQVLKVPITFFFDGLGEDSGKSSIGALELVSDRVAGDLLKSLSEIQNNDVRRKLAAMTHSIAQALRS